MDAPLLPSMSIAYLSVPFCPLFWGAQNMGVFGCEYSCNILHKRGKEALYNTKERVCIFSVREKGCVYILHERVSHPRDNGTLYEQHPAIHMTLGKASSLCWGVTRQHFSLVTSFWVRPSNVHSDLNRVWTHCCVHFLHVFG